MNRPFRIDNLFRYAALCLSAALLTAALYGCADKPSLQEQTSSVQSQQELSEQRELELQQLSERIHADIPAVYLTASGSDAVSGSDGPDIVPADADVQTAALIQLRNASKNMLRENYDICTLLAAEENAQALDSVYAQLTTELDGCTSLSELRDTAASMDSRLFASIAVDPAAENAVLSTQFLGYTDAEGELWLCAYTNAALPGFEDADKAYSLTILLDNGKTAAAAADSIYAHECIQYINQYAVRFRLSDILGEQATVEELLSGSSRVIFSINRTDNSCTLSSEHYKWRVTDTLQADPLAARIDLAAIIADYE